MSAYMEPEDSYWLKHHTDGKPLEDFDRAVLESVFDQETDFDIEKIKQNRIDTIKLKRFSLYQILLYPISRLLGVLFLDKTAIRYNVETIGIYWDFLFNKIDLETFRKSLQNKKKSVKLI